MKPRASRKKAPASIERNFSKDEMSRLRREVFDLGVDFEEATTGALELIDKAISDGIDRGTLGPLSGRLGGLLMIGARAAELMTSTMNAHGGLLRRALGTVAGGPG